MLRLPNSNFCDLVRFYPLSSTDIDASEDQVLTVTTESGRRRTENPVWETQGFDGSGNVNCGFLSYDATNVRPKTYKTT